MRYSMTRRSITIEANTPIEFDARLNEALTKTASGNPQIIDFPNYPLMVRIYYTEERAIPESIAEEYELCGRREFCEACPYFQPQLNKDGTRKRTSKRGFCGLKAAPTFSDMSACNDYYESLERGGLNDIQ